MYDAITDQLAKEEELERLVGSFGTTGNHRQQQQPQPGTAAGAAHARRRLLSADDDHSLFGGSSTTTTDDRVVGLIPSRQLLQHAGADAGVTGVPGNPESSSSGGAGGGVAASAGGSQKAGVESDPDHTPLTQEALESFQIFEDTGGVAGAGGGAAGAAQGDAQQQLQQQQGVGGVTEPEDAAQVAAGGHEGETVAVA